jgi:hypothetical protein
MTSSFGSTRFRYGIGSVAVLLASGLAFSLPKPSPTLEQDFSWSNPRHSIFNPTFSHSGRELAFVQQFHIPDGHESEEREGVAQSRLAKIATNKRLADPIVSLLTLGNKQALQLDYGWNPAFSLDDKLLAYTFQKTPISGKRVLAQTLAGNPLKLYHRDTKKRETVASPATGFLLEPTFVNSATLYYKVGAATNGAYGGAVGLRQYNLLSKRDSVLYAPRKSFGNAHLIGDVYLMPQGASYLIWLPQDEGYYMATEYLATLRTPWALLHSFGKMGFKNLEGRISVAEGGDIVYLDDQHKLRRQQNYFVRYHSTSIVYKKLITDQYQRASLSPDGRRVLICPYEDKPFILEITTFKRTTLALLDTEVYSAVWSATSDKLAIVQDDGTQDTDIILVFTVR